MRSPDRIWIEPAWAETFTRPDGDPAKVAYTRGDLIQPAAVKPLGTLAMNDEGGLYLTDQPDNSLVAVAVRDADMPWRRAHPDVIDAIVERFNAPALHPASPLGAVMEVPEVRALVEAFKDQNELMRSALEIAKREGINGEIGTTNWDAYYNKVAVSLKRSAAALAAIKGPKP